MPLDDAPAAYHLFAQKRDGCIKVALLPNGTTADRVDAWGTRAWRLARVVTPLALLGFVAPRILGGARR